MYKYVGLCGVVRINASVQEAKRTPGAGPMWELNLGVCRSSKCTVLSPVLVYAPEQVLSIMRFLYYKVKTIKGKKG